MNRIKGKFPVHGTQEEQIAFLLDALNASHSDDDTVELESLSGGITNSIYQFNVGTRKHIVRVFGNNTDRIIEREVELNNIIKIGLIKVYAVFENGVIVSYQEGEPLTPTLMSEDSIMCKTAALIGKFHSKTRNDTEKHKNAIFEKIQNFINKIDKDVIFNNEKCNVDQLQERFDQLKEKLMIHFKDADIILSHNDLLSGNILYDGNNVNVIDYEYSSYTWPHFDIANHFFEMCGFEIDLNRYPSVEKQRRFIKIYLKNYYGEEQSDDVVEKWVKDIGDMVPLTCMYWGTWAYFQHSNSKVDFPYFEYAKNRIIFTKIRLPLPKDHKLMNESPLVKSFKY